MKQYSAEMPVASICNGTVIDHIPSDKLFKVAALLHLDTMESPITIGNNFPSKVLGRKGIIKIADHFFDGDIVNRIALIAPNVHLNVIRDYKVVEKKSVELPSEIVGIVRCSNPKCITNNEPMPTRFLALQGHEKGVIQCAYCGRKVVGTEVDLQ
ncbi:aspartate carbamoyltransferase regulatory subunit [Porphyromonas endodontalis]|uniref:aspartate carbamoyltransferase regulatory subunit n=1 Tax=Porphyromonas endodontalis TaxID=28124 RepID=UPI0028E5D494|nr:aspartate carbamoyltransferase regulatory subunit [Porphyromonas endodontalis]